MEPTTDSNRTFQLVDGDKDVLLIEEDSFTVSKFKELIRRDLAGKFSIGHQTRLDSSFIKISLGEKRLDLDHINWICIQDGELLKTGSKGWEKGKFRIKCVIKITYKTEYNGSYYTDVQVDIEFSPDEPPQPESPLDDLRELPEYKQQL